MLDRVRSLPLRRIYVIIYSNLNCNADYDHIFQNLFLFRYNVMSECWNEEAKIRPTFTDLRKKLGVLKKREVDFFSLDSFLDIDT